MTASDYISIGSLIIATAAFIYSYLTNTKKYELTSQYRTEVLNWYADTISILAHLRSEAISGFQDKSLKSQLMCKLSANIEIGRFYFPNVDKGDNYGSHKPIAYKGYRNIMLDFLVYSYQIFEKADSNKFIKHATSLQKHFTSCMYEVLDPKSFLTETKKHTNKTFSKNLSFEEYLSNDADNLKNYI